MQTSTGFGVVLFAKDLDRLSDFYAAVTGFTVVVEEPDHAVLESHGFQFVLVQAPDEYVVDIAITSPPRRREETPLKPCLPVASLPEARSVAARLGGVVDPPDREWTFGALRVCDGHDPEGNVFQLRCPAGP